MSNEIDTLAVAFGVHVPAECAAGVQANYAILSRHVTIIAQAATDAPVDPAELLAP